MLTVENLEARELPSTVALADGQLFVLGDQRDNVIVVAANPVNTDQIQVVVDGVTRSFGRAQVQQILMSGGQGNDILTQSVGTIPTIVRGGAGNDNIWTFGSDLLFGDEGNDTIYSIIGASTIGGGQGRDRLIGNTMSMFRNDRADRPNVVFGSSTAPVQLINGVVYLLGTAGDDSADIRQQGNALVVAYNGQIFCFARNRVDTIAGILGAGNDRVVNTSAIDGVFYGAAGNDTLLGGSGDDLLKGGGDNDLLQGNAGADDLTSDPGADTLAGGGGQDIVRIDAADTVAAGADQVIGQGRS